MRESSDVQIIAALMKMFPILITPAQSMENMIIDYCISNTQ